MGLLYPVGWGKGTPAKGTNIQVPVYWCPMSMDSVGKWSRERSGGGAVQSWELELSSLKADRSVLVYLPTEASLFPEPEPKAARASHRAHSRELCKKRPPSF